MEGDSCSAISWVLNSASGPWKFYFYFSEIKLLSSAIEVEFRLIICSANEEADLLAKRGASE